MKRWRALIGALLLLAALAWLWERALDDGWSFGRKAPSAPVDAGPAPDERP